MTNIQFALRICAVPVAVPSVTQRTSDPHNGPDDGLPSLQQASWVRCFYDKPGSLNLSLICLMIRGLPNLKRALGFHIS